MAGPDLILKPVGIPGIYHLDLTIAGRELNPCTPDNELYLVPDIHLASQRNSVKSRPSCDHTTPLLTTLNNSDSFFSTCLLGRMHS